MAPPEEALPDRALWARAVAVTAVVVAVMLAARELRPLVAAATFLARTGDPMLSSVAWGSWVRAATWVAVAVAVVAGLGAAAAVTALSAAAVPLLGTYYGPVHVDARDSLLVPIFEIRSNVDNAVHGLVPVAGLLLVLAAAGWVERGVRPRVYALIAVIAAAYGVLQLGMPFPFGTASIVPTLLPG